MSSQDLDMSLDGIDAPPKKKGLFGFYSDSKSKILGSVYNAYRRYPTEAPEFTSDPIWMIGGQCYCCGSHVTTGSSKTTKQQYEHAIEFVKDFGQITWFSYRKDFPALGTSKLTTDIGWGCMLRAGQMMLARTLTSHFLGRDWKLNDEDSQPFSQYRSILRMFNDSPTAASPFSVHNIVNRNRALQGDTDRNLSIFGEEWFAPSVIAKVLKSLVNSGGPDDLCIYVSLDGSVYKDVVEHICLKPRDPPPGEAPSPIAWRSMLILLPLRLGVDKTNSTYFGPLLETFRFPQSVGIIGGKPRQAYYFVANQGDKLIYMDPHIVQPSASPDQPFCPESYHCRVPQQLNISNLDPSLAIGFYCRDRPDFEDFYFRASSLQTSGDPIFFVGEKKPSYGSGSDDDLDSFLAP